MCGFLGLGLVRLPFLGGGFIVLDLLVFVGFGIHLWNWLGWFGFGMLVLFIFG